MDGEAVAGGAEVADVARRISADADAELLGWSAAPLVDLGVIDTTGGLYRVDGRVRSRGADGPWTAVLKVLVRPPDPECHEPGSWCYWRREAAFYGSGVATGLPGTMRAPQPFAVVERDAVAHVWMEHVAVAAGR